MTRNDTFENSTKIRLLHAANRLLSRAYHHVDVIGPVSVPARGPAMIVSNHISSLDPLLIQAVVQRPIAWMVAKEYFNVPGLGWLFRTIRSIPVARDGRDSAAIRAAMRTLSEGRVLGVFPEGRIARTRDPIPLQTGAAMLAVRSGATVVPAFQWGTTFGASMLGAFCMPQRVSLRFGEPVRFSRSGPSGSTSETAESQLERMMLNLRGGHNVEMG